MATALRLVIAAGCITAVAVLLVGPGGPLGGAPSVGRGLLPAGADGALLAAVMVLGAGVANLVVRGSPLVGWLGVGLGAALIAASGVGLRSLPVFLPPIAATAAAVVPIMLCAEAVALDSGRAPRTTRRLMAALAVIGGTIAIIRLASYSPFFDPACTFACVRTQPLLDLSASAQIGFARAVDAAGLGAATVAVLIGVRAILTRAPGLLSRRLAYIGVVLAGAVLAGASAMALAGRQPRASPLPEGTAVMLASLLEVAGLVTLSVGLWLGIALRLRLRSRIRRVATEIGDAPGVASVERLLSEALGETAVEVGYAAADGEGFVSTTGGPFDLPARGSGQSTTTIERLGRPVAVIRHRASLEQSIVRAELTPSVLVAIDNERLRALGLAALRSLREARSRIVAAEDGERRRIERDLHDGAQQQILAIAFELRLAQSQAERAGEVPTARRLARAESLALVALDDLRHVARSIHPAILGQGGLAPALSSLAEDVPVAMTLDMERSLRLAPLVEAAAYQVVAEAVSDAATVGASEVTVAVSRSDSTLTLDLEFDGHPPSPWPVRIADRVGAAGGDLTVDRIGRDRTRLHAVMPCA